MPVRIYVGGQQHGPVLGSARNRAKTAREAGQAPVRAKVLRIGSPRGTTPKGEPPGADAPAR